MEITDSFLTLLQFRSGFHSPDLPDIRGDRHGLDHLSASPLRDRSHLLQWPCRRRTLVAGFIASSATPPGTSTPSPCRCAELVVTILAPGTSFSWAVDDTLCRKRGLTLYGAGVAVRPPHLQSHQILGQLGTRLGRADPDRRLPRLGTVQSFRLAHRHARVPEPPRADQGEKNAKGKKGKKEIHQTQARSESSHAT